jgi:3-hydroxyisobutyrate dehydrogenase-like beta-hydroxyacid dehydrogenase
MTIPAKPTVGFIGLGIMGSPMASNLQKAGYTIVVHDSRHEAAEPHLKAGATWADTPRALAEKCEVIFTCLPNLSAIEDVALGPSGLVAGIRQGHALFEMSTNSAELLKRIYAAFAERNAHVLDAPISGGGPGARRGRLAAYVGGDRAVYQLYEPIVRAMCDRPIYVGKVGSGLVTKLVHNCASQCIQAAIAEVFSMGVKAGADPLSLWEAIRLGAVGRRRTFDGLVDQFLPGLFDHPQAALRIIEKDMMLATELGRSVGAPMRIANLAFADITEAMNRGWSERDSRAVMLLPQERVGIQIKVDPEAIRGVLLRDPAAPTDTRYGEGN